MSSPFQQKFSGKSPLKQGAYESAADNPVYVSNQPAMNAMQDAIAEVGVAAIKASNTPEKKAKRLSKRIKRRGKREEEKIKDGTWIAPQKGSAETEGNKGYNKAHKKTDKLQERLDSTLKEVESNKNNKKSKAFFCKGRAAGSHLDSYGNTVTCP